MEYNSELMDRTDITNYALSSEIKTLLSYYEDLKGKLLKKDSGPKFKVGESLSSVAHLYERLRYTVDYKKENLLRRNAIERILKRILWEKGEGNLSLLAETLLRELIWAKYVKNDFYPLSKINEIAGIIKKYLFLASNLAVRNEEKGKKWKDWLISVSSCEIEECLDPRVISVDVLSMAVESWFEKNFNWTDLGSGEDDNQLAIAIHRSLVRGDEAKNSYFLLRRLYKGWTSLTISELEKNADEIYKVCKKIRESLNNPIQSKLYRFVQKEVAAFQILKDLVEDNLDQALQTVSDSEKLTKAVNDKCEERYDEIRDRVNRGIVRSVVYIFITKIILAIAVEVPYEYFFLKRISVLPLVSTIIIPLIFVFLVTATIRRPGEDNTKRITDIINNFVYQKQISEKVDFSLLGQAKDLTYKIFTGVYATIFLVIFSLISYALARVGYDAIGIGIFFIFLSLVLLFGYRVKFSASELNVTYVKESLASNLLTNVSLPFLDLGVWLADKFASLNFFVALFDFLIEAPLKNIMGVLDEWITYLKERREEAVEIPVER